MPIWQITSHYISQEWWDDHDLTSMIRVAILILIIVTLYWQVQDAVIYLNDHRYTFPGQLRIFVIKFVSSGTPEPTSQCICRPIIKIWWKMYISSDRRNSRKIRSNISACHISYAVVWPDQPLNDWVIFFSKCDFIFWCCSPYVQYFRMNLVQYNECLVSIVDTDGLVL